MNNRSIDHFHFQLLWNHVEYVQDEWQDINIGCLSLDNFKFIVDTMEDEFYEDLYLSIFAEGRTDLFEYAHNVKGIQCGLGDLPQLIAHSSGKRSHRVDLLVKYLVEKGLFDIKVDGPEAIANCFKADLPLNAVLLENAWV
jgi:hypothetical protein